MQVCLPKKKKIRPPSPKILVPPMSTFINVGHCCRWGIRRGQCRRSRRSSWTMEWSIWARRSTSLASSSRRQQLTCINTHSRQQQQQNLTINRTKRPKLTKNTLHFLLQPQNQTNQPLINHKLPPKP